MVLRFLLPLAIGATLGALLGRTNACVDGSCPLTANPLRGALWGAFLGLLFALNMGCSPKPAAEPAKDADGPSPVHHVSTQAELDALTKENKVVAVDFYATWCPPCRTYGPVFEAVARKRADDAAFAKIDIEKGGALAEAFKVKNIPTTVIIRGGEETNRFLGALSEMELEQAL